MKLLCLVAASMGCLGVTALCCGDERQEPLLNLTLLVDGTSIPVELGRKKELVGEFKNPTVSVRAASSRRFTYGGISFEYPTNFAWEAEVKAGYRQWTMDGNHCVIMYFVSSSEFTPEMYARGVAGQFGASNATIAPFQRRFGDTTLKGQRITILVGGAEIVQDALAVPAPDGQWRMLLLQSVAPEKTPELEEPRRVLDLLQRTLQVKHDRLSKRSPRAESRYESP